MSETEQGRDEEGSTIARVSRDDGRAKEGRTKKSSTQKKNRRRRTVSRAATIVSKRQELLEWLSCGGSTRACSTLSVLCLSSHFVAQCGGLGDDWLLLRAACSVVFFFAAPWLTFLLCAAHLLLLLQRPPRKFECSVGRMVVGVADDFQRSVQVVEMMIRKKVRVPRNTTRLRGRRRPALNRRDRQHGLRAEQATVTS